MTEAKSTKVEDISTIVKNAHKAFENGATKKYETRIKNLKLVQKYLNENKNLFYKALETDLQMNELGCFAEVVEMVRIAQEAIENLHTWMAAKPVPVPLLQKPGSGCIEKEPFGVTLIIAPWNYPTSLVIKPMIGAIAAGNAVVIKPSEVTASVSNVFAETFKKYFTGDEFGIITGGVDETTALLKEKFNYIFYTGAPLVGKLVLKAAAEHLCPVTLELGGKSPVYVDDEVSLDVAISRIAWGKWLNCGQTCVAPDYILCHKKVKDQFMKKLIAKIEEFYGKDPQKSPDYGRVVSVRHVKRVLSLLEDQKIHHGGRNDIDDRYIEPTLIDEPKLDSQLMKKEIFGPVLPIIGVDNLDGAIKFILKMKDRPLAAYIFCSNSTKIQKFVDNVPSGTAASNEVIMQFLCDDLPFGGCGKSGLGRGYNGRQSFDIFSHEKSVLHRATFVDPFVRYPPYSKARINTVIFLQKFRFKDYYAYLALPVILGIIAFIFKFLRK
eukprot:gene1866-1007_t